MRKRISEQNVFPNFDLYSEYLKIEKLLSKEKIVGVIHGPYTVYDHQLTLEEYIQDECFNNWNLRGTFVSISEMRQGLGIERYKINSENNDQILDFLQYAINCAHRVSMRIKKSKKYVIRDDSILVLLMENIVNLVEKLDCKLELDEDTQEIFVLYNKPFATVVAKEYPDIEESIAEYSRIDTRGYMKRKGEILCTLFKKLESIESKLKANNFGAIASDATFLFNKSGIRHWVEEDEIACETFMKMDEKELEIWYDKTFNLFLTCMVLAKYIDDMQDIKNIKRTVGG